MDKNTNTSIALTIAEQLVATTPRDIFFSWGISEKFRAGTFQDMAALRFKVNGRLFQGDVTIAYDEGVDYYEIYLSDQSGTRLLRDRVCFDEMSEIIDIAIERGENQEEYEEFCEQEYQKLMRGHF